MLKLLKECKKYSVSTYAQVEISLNTCRNTLDFMCDLELFPKIWSHIMIKSLVTNANIIILLNLCWYY